MQFASNCVEREFCMMFVSSHKLTLDSSVMPNSKPVLYSYWRSSCSWRVRIALNLKKVDYEYKTINLLSKEDLNSPDFLAVNPAGKVPALVVDGVPLTESMAIMEYIDETYPGGCPILPKDPIHRAQSRAIALQIVAGIQPIQNLRVLKYLNEQTPGSGAKVL
ncbi:putative maleylacetoacetate isomerase [Ancylostoma caninum]|uniref:Putative maleylacetoacetate isomerase n=1 Tax=Ancylostoma caninum TaxID=29170 RepID=A0A368FKN9_ANCCA|nr:putative maleylacetoacetate isomerase [Ancylostoma caninum]